MFVSQAKYDRLKRDSEATIALMTRRLLEWQKAGAMVEKQLPII